MGWPLRHVDSLTYNLRGEQKHSSSVLCSYCTIFLSAERITYNQTRSNSILGRLLVTDPRRGRHRASWGRDCSSLRNSFVHRTAQMVQASPSRLLQKLTYFFFPPQSQDRHTVLEITITRSLLLSQQGMCGPLMLLCTGMKPAFTHTL